MKRRQNAVVRPGYHPSKADWSAFRANQHTDVSVLIGTTGFLGFWTAAVAAAGLGDMSDSILMSVAFFTACGAIWAGGAFGYARWVRKGRQRVTALMENRDMLPMWLVTTRDKEFWHRHALLVEARENARKLSTDLGVDAVRELDALEWRLASILADVFAVKKTSRKSMTDADTATAEKTLIVLKEALRRTNEQIESLADSITAALEMEGVAGPNALASIKTRAEGYLLPTDSHTRELLETYTHAIEQVSQPSREVPATSSSAARPVI